MRFLAAGVARPVRSTGCRRPPFRRCCSLLIILQGISSGFASTSKQPCTSLRRGLLVHIHCRGGGAGRLLAGWPRTRLDPAAEAVSVRVGLHCCLFWSSSHPANPSASPPPVFHVFPLPYLFLRRRLCPCARFESHGQHPLWHLHGIERRDGPVPPPLPPPSGGANLWPANGPNLNLSSLWRVFRTADLLSRVDVAPKGGWPPRK